MDIKIGHCPTKSNSDTNALSSNPAPDFTQWRHVVLSVGNVSSSEPPLTTLEADTFLLPNQKIAEYQQKGPDLSQIIDYLEQDTLPHDEK